MNIRNEYIPPKVSNFFDQAVDYVRHQAKDARRLAPMISPSRSLPTTKVVGLLAVGMAAGAALAYFLDSKSGAERRRNIKEKGMQWTKEARDVVSQQAKDFSEKARGTFDDVKHAVSSRTPEMDVSSTSTSTTRESTGIH